MQQLISKLETIPISLSTLQKYAPKHCRVLLYDRIPLSKEAFFRGKTCVIVLYQMHSRDGRKNTQVGHYCLVMRTPGSKHLRYFSSYGLKPETEIHMTHSVGKLLKLLGKDYTYNRTQLQSARRVQTCGLHALARSYLYKLSDSAYNKLMKRYTAKNPDDIVSIMTLCLVFEELEGGSTPYR